MRYHDLGESIRSMCAISSTSDMEALAFLSLSARAKMIRTRSNSHCTDAFPKIMVAHCHSRKSQKRLHLALMEHYLQLLQQPLGVANPSLAVGDVVLYSLAEPVHIVNDSVLGGRPLLDHLLQPLADVLQVAIQLGAQAPDLIVQGRVVRAGLLARPARLALPGLRLAGHPPAQVAEQLGEVRFEGGVLLCPVGHQALETSTAPLLNFDDTVDLRIGVGQTGLVFLLNDLLQLADILMHAH